jgi:hypothetical protein
MYVHFKRQTALYMQVRSDFIDFLRAKGGLVEVQKTGTYTETAEKSRMDGWMDGWMGGGMDGWVGGWMDGQMDGWMDGWMGGWVVGWVGG